MKTLKKLLLFCLFAFVLENAPARAIEEGRCAEVCTKPDRNEIEAADYKKCVLEKLCPNAFRYPPRSAKENIPEWLDMLLHGVRS